MKLEGSQVIAADRETVWAALNDPDVLRASIPGCLSLEMNSETELHARVKQKIGPVSATFDGTVNLSELNPPESYHIAGEGKGGAAGFAKGGADVRLTETDEGTLLEYAAEAKVGGKLAQLGARVVSGVAHKVAEQFFANFKAEVEGAGAAEAEPEAAVAETETPDAAAAAPAATGAAQSAAADAEAGDGEKKGFWKKLFG